MEIRLHGRGGQGAVTAANILAQAAIGEGKWAQSFPMFGPERRGAPVVAFARIAEEPILIRSEVYKPDIVAVFDPTLLRSKEVIEGLKLEGVLIANTTKTFEEIREIVGFSGKVAVIDATKIALEELKSGIVNTAILGALVKATNVVKLDSVLAVIGEHWPGAIGEANVRATLRAYNEVLVSP